MLLLRTFFPCMKLSDCSSCHMMDFIWEPGRPRPDGAALSMPSSVYSTYSNTRYSLPLVL